MPCEIEQHRDDAHRLLRVVAAVAERVERGRDELQLAERAVDGERASRARRSTRRRAPAAAPARSPVIGDSDDRRDRLGQAAPDDGADARLGDAGADQAADQRVRAATRECRAHQVTTFQTIAPISAPKITRVVDDAGGDDAGADGLGHVQAEEQEGDEVEERRPRRPRIAAAARASRRWSRSNWPRRAGR